MFGIVDTSHQPALGIIPARNAATLLPIIQAHTAPGSTVNFDQWGAYQQVQSLQNVAAHATVNHSLHFVDPVTGVPTQHVESLLKQGKN